MKYINCINDFIYKILFFIGYGFYFYFVLIFGLISQLFPGSKLFKNIFRYYKKKQFRTYSLIVLITVIIIISFMGDRIYTNNHKVINTSKFISNYKRSANNNFSTYSISSNLLKHYRKIGFDKVNFNKLKSVNSDIFAWMMVDNTYINYPIVKSKNNSFYNNHSIDKSNDSNGWMYMDYRNSTLLNNRNSIFYGKSINEFDSFSSLSLLDSDKWLNKSNHNIVIFTSDKKYIYRVISLYKDDTLSKQLIFKDDGKYLMYLDSLGRKSKYDFGGIFKKTDKIITLISSDKFNKKIVIHGLLTSVSNW